MQILWDEIEWNVKKNHLMQPNWTEMNQIEPNWMQSLKPKNDLLIQLSKIFFNISMKKSAKAYWTIIVIYIYIYNVVCIGNFLAISQPILAQNYVPTLGYLRFINIDAMYTINIYPFHFQWKCNISGILAIHCRKFQCKVTVYLINRILLQIFVM